MVPNPFAIHVLMLTGLTVVICILGVLLNISHPFQLTRMNGLYFTPRVEVIYLYFLIVLIDQYFFKISIHSETAC